MNLARKLNDIDTNLVRFGARDYDSQSARWTSKNPIRFDGDTLNIYRYVNNDPVNLIDPGGLLHGVAHDKPGPPDLGSPGPGENNGGGQGGEGLLAQEIFQAIENSLNPGFIESPYNPNIPTPTPPPQSTRCY